MGNEAKENVERGYIMVINDEGIRKKVSLSDFNAGKVEGFKYDLQWDLSHGFKEAKKAFDDIEKSHYSEHL